MKEYVGQMASNEWGHVVLCCALSAVDDTAIMIKTILPEIKNNLQELVESSHGRQVLLQLLSPDNHRYFSSSTLEMLHPPQRVVKGTSAPSTVDEEDEDLDFGVNDQDSDDDDLLQPKKKGGKAGKAKPKAAPEEADEELEADEKPAGERILGLSKKDPLLRRKELLGKGDKSLTGALIKLCCEQTGSLLRSPAGCDVIAEVARGGDDGVLLDLDEAGVSRVHDAIVSCIASGPDDDKADDEAGPAPQQEHLLLHYYSSRALRRLVLASAEDGRSGQCAAKFVHKLWSSVLQGQLKQWVGTHADKVVGSLLHCGCPDVKKAAANGVKPLLKEPVDSWSQKFVAKVTDDAGGQKSKSKTRKAKS
jgi:pumilio family protein 6